MLRFTCPKCKEINQRPDQDAGQVVACSFCDQKVRVPAGKSVASKPAKPRDEPMDVLEEVEEPSSRRRKAKEEIEEVEEIQEVESNEEESEEEEDRPRKKKKQKAKAVLGPVKSRFEASKGALIFGMVCCVMLGLGGLAFIGAAVAKREPGFVVASVFMIPLGIGGFLWCMSLMTLKVVLHEGGIVHSRHGKRRMISWFEIQSVWQQVTEHYTNGAYTGTTYVYTLQLDDGTRIVYTNSMLGRVERLGKAILDMTARAIYPLAMMAYDRGEVVEFGSLGVSKKGLYYGSSLLRWREIDEIQIKAGYVSVSKRGKWFNWCNIAASSIPNLYVFLAMVNQIVGVQNG